MKNVILKLFPLLLFYIVLVLLLSSTVFQEDEISYVAAASRLSQGYISSSHDIKLWYGPGYPAVLIPFILLKLPWLLAKLLNAVWLFGAVLYFYKSLALWLPENFALISSFLMGLYPSFWRLGYVLAPESLEFLLICGFIFHFCMAHRGTKRAWLHIALASFLLGYLALTKVFYGYVVLVGLLSYLILYLWKRGENFKTTISIYLLALACCIPYLLYTYSLTGKIFYWGTSGGMSLYWMSTPFENESGDWFSFAEVQQRPELVQHREFFDQIAGLSQVEQDNEFKKQAIANITQHPAKYVKNWLANIGRLIFSYPYSFTQQKLSTFFYIIPNMFLVVGFILGIYPAFVRQKSIPYELYSLLYFSAIAFGGTSLLSAFERQFRPLVPVLVLWLSFLYIRVVRIELRPISEIKST